MPFVIAYIDDVLQSLFDFITHDKTEALKAKIKLLEEDQVDMTSEIKYLLKNEKNLISK